MRHEVRARAVETSWGGSSEATYRILAAAGGGSRLQAEWAHLGVTKPHEKVLIAILNRFPMSTCIARLHVEALDRYAEAERPTLRG